ncbi:Uncharacterised protein [[Clostridium] sordellii]|uniref:hypothetical protein n=1 Tax=Paraclostridium sordellii TaxID=1505 RepID=UPI0005408BA5|nr:hypothetical protein [Paeniclostridium sordellii]CEK36650.1 hypothetical protein UMC2PCS14_00741 (plasmid) [[Clostridium] sordellii] [Paeniclostridium sordellii]CEP46140.1 Uncharacterised protein [[Clostridium] sordellii] [Paeniclostridium sordellii]
MSNFNEFELDLQNEKIQNEAASERVKFTTWDCVASSIFNCPTLKCPTKGVLVCPQPPKPVNTKSQCSSTASCRTTFKK